MEKNVTNNNFNVEKLYKMSMDEFIERSKDLDEKALLTEECLLSDQIIYLNTKAVLNITKALRFLMLNNSNGFIIDLISKEYKKMCNFLENKKPKEKYEMTFGFFQVIRSVNSFTDLKILSDMSDIVSRLYWFDLAKSIFHDVNLFGYVKQHKEEKKIDMLIELVSRYVKVKNKDYEKENKEDTELMDFDADSFMKDFTEKKPSYYEFVKTVSHKNKKQVLFEVDEIAKKMMQTPINMDRDDVKMRLDILDETRFRGISLKEIMDFIGIYTKMYLFLDSSEKKLTFEWDEYVKLNKLMSFISINIRGFGENNCAILDYRTEMVNKSAKDKSFQNLSEKMREFTYALESYNIYISELEEKEKQEKAQPTPNVQELDEEEKAMYQNLDDLEEVE